MSVYAYYECMGHTPPLRSVQEVGQRWYQNEWACDFARHRNELIDSLSDVLSVDDMIHGQWDFVMDKLWNAGVSDWSPARVYAPRPNTVNGKAIPEDMDDSSRSAYFAALRMPFLAQHRYCTIRVVDEYGREVGVIPGDTPPVGI